jgi:phosphate-selective porin OprO/OprP
MQLDPARITSSLDPLRGRPSYRLLSFLTLVVAAKAVAKPPVELPSSASVSAGDNGFTIASPDGEWSLRLRTHVQAVARFIFGDGDGGVADAFILRSARPYIEGLAFGMLDYRLMPDFGNGRAIIQDGYLRLRAVPWLQLTAGKMKVPFGLERLQGEATTYFAERGLPTALAPNRDVGFVLSSELWKGALLLELGAFDGQADNTLTDGDSSDGKDLVARISGFPFRGAGTPALEGLGLGVAVTWGEETRGDVEAPKYATSASQTFFRYRAAADDGTGGVQPDGERLRLTGHLQYNESWFGLLAEVVWARHTLVRDEATVTAEHLAWQIATDFALYGGDSRFDGVRPNAPLGFGEKAGSGAFTLAVRYGELALDESVFPTFADPDKSARYARSAGAALSWWATRNFRVMADFQFTRFEGGAAGGDRPNELAFTTRLQLSL